MLVRCDSFEFLNCNHSIQTYILDNCNVWMEIFLENAWYTSVREISFFSVMQGHIEQESYRKNIGFRLVSSALYIIFIRPCTKWFPSVYFSTKSIEAPKIFIEDQVKIFMENSSWRPCEYYLKAIYKLSDKWQEVIVVTHLKKCTESPRQWCSWGPYKSSNIILAHPSDPTETIVPAGDPPVKIRPACKITQYTPQKKKKI